MTVQLNMFERTPTDVMIDESRARNVDPAAVTNTSNRARPVIAARHAIAHILRVDHRMSYPKIGQVLGMDHSSVMYACRKVAAGA